MTAGMIPSFTSVNAEQGVLVRDAMSEHATSPAPPPSACPCAAQTTGAGQPSTVRASAGARSRPRRCRRSRDRRSSASIRRRRRRRSSVRHRARRPPAPVPCRRTPPRVPRSAPRRRRCGPPAGQCHGQEVPSRSIRSALTGASLRARIDRLLHTRVRFPGQYRGGLLMPGLPSLLRRLGGGPGRPPRGRRSRRAAADRSRPCSPAPTNCSGWYRSAVSVTLRRDRTSRRSSARRPVPSRATPRARTRAAPPKGTARRTVSVTIRVDRTPPAVGRPRARPGLRTAGTTARSA